MGADCGTTLGRESQSHSFVLISINLRHPFRLRDTALTRRGEVLDTPGETGPDSGVADRHVS